MNPPESQLHFPDPNSNTKSISTVKWQKSDQKSSGFGVGHAPDFPRLNFTALDRKSGTARVEPPTLLLRKEIF
jgi:hypothetical protein